MPEFSLADLLAAQAGAPGPVYEGSQDPNLLTLARVLSASGQKLSDLGGLFTPYQGYKGEGFLGGLTPPVPQAVGELGKTASDIAMLPGRTATGGYNVTPEVPGQYSDVDEARRQLNEAHAGRSAFDLASLMIGAPGGAGGVGSGVRSQLGEVPSFTERMDALKDAAFQRAQRGTATGDYGLGTARRTEPPPPAGSMEDAHDRLMSSLRDTQRQLAEYKNPPAGPILAPGESDVSFFSGGNKKAGAALAAEHGVPHAEYNPSQPVYLRIGQWNPKTERGTNYARGEIEHGVSAYDLDKAGKPIAPAEGEWADADLRDRLRGSEPKFLIQGDHVGVGHDGEPLLRNVRVVGVHGEPLPTAATTEMTPIGEQYVLPGAERASEATMAQRAADAPLKAEVPQKPPGGMFSDEGNQGSLFSGGNKRAGTLLALAKGEQPAPYDFLTGRRPDAPYPQFAERYPDIGPPTPKPKDKPSFPGETYPAKTLTPEAEQFAKTREKIISQMDKEGYQPFFDPSQRFPAKWEKQPGPHVDTAQAVAKRQETIDRHLETIGAEETRKKFREGYARGLDLPDSQAWYLMGQVEKKMVQDMGEEAGRKHFRDSIATAMSATTTGQTPKTNLIMAQYLNYLKKTGQPFPTEAHMTPVTVGGQRVMPNIEAYQEIMGEGGGYHALGLENPKRTDFAQAQMGNPNAYTFDEQMSHRTLGKDVPAGGTYGLATTVGREEAARAGVIPQRHQDVTWAGFKKMLEEEFRAKKGFRPYGEGEGYQGKPLIAEVNDMIERTHRITGVPRQEIWTRGFIKNEIPLYGAAGLTMGGVLLGQTQEPTSPK